MLPRTDLTGAVEVAKRIRGRVAEDNKGRKATTTPVTLSIGIAEYPKHGDDATTLIAAADAALYGAKRRGRNRIVRASATKRKSTARPRGKKARKRATSASGIVHILICWGDVEVAHYDDMLVAIEVAA